MMCTKIFFMEAYYIILHSKIEENATTFDGRIRSGRRHDNSDHYIVIIIVIYKKTSLKLL